MRFVISAWSAAIDCPCRADVSKYLWCAIAGQFEMLSSRYRHRYRHGMVGGLRFNRVHVYTCRKVVR